MCSLAADLESWPQGAEQGTETRGELRKCLDTDKDSRNVDEAMTADSEIQETRKGSLNKGACHHIDPC